MNIPNPIEIKYYDSQGTVIDLIDLLQLIKKDKQKLVWSILDLEAVGDIKRIWERGLVDLEESIKYLPQGYILSWQGLVSLAKKLDDVINIVIVACNQVTQIPTLTSDKDLYYSCEIVLELIDSSVWRIYAKDKRLLLHLHHEFSGEIRIAAINSR